MMLVKTSVIAESEEILVQKNRRSFFIVQPTKTIFYLVFFLVFCFSGILTLIGINTGVFFFRMALISLLVVPLLLFHRPRLDRIAVAYLCLALLVGVSAWYNRSFLIDMVLFLRILVFSYLIYYLVERFITTQNITRIIKLSIVIGLIQLPVVIFQLLTYNLLPQRIAADIGPVDYDFGTFNYKGDYALCFFLLSLIIFLLFDEKRNHIVKRRIPVVLWFSVTVLITNSEMAKLILVIVWGGYALTRLHRKTTIYILLSLAFVLGSLTITGILNDIIARFIATLQSTQRQFSGDPAYIEAFLRGSYSRGAAVYYYLNQGVLWFGDGPSKYSNAITRELSVGNMGHIFTFYSEIGLLGWLMSILIFFLVAFRLHRGRMRLNWVPFLLFMSVLILGFTSQVMNDIAIFFMYCLMAKSYLIPSRNLVQSGITIVR